MGGALTTCKCLYLDVKDALVYVLENNLLRHNNVFCLFYSLLDGSQFPGDGETFATIADDPPVPFPEPPVRLPRQAVDPAWLKIGIGKRIRSVVHS